ncbi:NaeI family type II restriction endonuclease [Streptomyces liangshanensis]|uniref:Restriction endonuclease n=1 Tax=Streptomyces liangshanensis TaxID=2717324 RepID=A0A6G9H085_9ACTN|nr:NaeI family type II restriction endonuclease [Streptomyces liangshanensis]QIQ03952.1 restriction endonuclease [Streptomyces liangshanensis]
MSQNTSLFTVESLQSGLPGPSSDPELESVRSWFLDQKNYAARFAQVFRKSIDEVLDGQRTQRYDLYVKKGEGRVEKTEKTYLGTKVEIVTRAEFGLGYGHPMDYSIQGVDVDAKFTMNNAWTIPEEAVGHICLLLHADDRESLFQVGLLRMSDDVLNAGTNRDGKRTVSAAGRLRIRWIVKNGEMPRNFLLELKKKHPEKIHAIFHASDKHRGPGTGGQLRVNELFRQVPGKLIDRNAAMTVATQHDGPKRIRDARNDLRPAGFVVLGHQQPGPRIAEDLGLPIPRNGSWVSAKLALATDDDSRRSTVVNGISYTLWREGDAHIEAPVITSSD